MNMGEHRISIEESTHQFLLASLFGSEYREQKVDDLEIAIHRAYRDFCRTIRDKNNPEIKKLDETKKAAEEIIKKYINELLDCNVQINYDAWHEKLCRKIVDENKYTYGQAQKWVNMTMKYLVVLDYKNVRDFIPQLHVPIDSDIINKLEVLGIITDDNKTPLIPWSSIQINPENDNIYTQLQVDIRNSEKIKPNPFEWEFSVWNTK